jgi:hypothetical protein
MGLGSEIRDPEKNLFWIPDPGSRGQKGTGSRIRIRNTGYELGEGGRGTFVLIIPVLRIRICTSRIHMLLGLPDPDPLVRDKDSDPSIIKEK